MISRRVGRDIWKGLRKERKGRSVVIKVYYHKNKNVNQKKVYNAFAEEVSSVPNTCQGAHNYL